MKTTLEIPDEIAAEVQRRAQQHGRELAEQLVRLLKLALLIEGDCDAAALAHLLRVAHRNRHRAELLQVSPHGRSTVLSTDPATGLPVINSPPDAPIRSMSADEILALIDQTQLEEDLERAGLIVRH
jgi:hypothetical protein